MTSRTIRLLLPSLLLLAATMLWATHPERWVVSSREAFLKGKFEGVSLSSDGRLLLAPALNPVYDTQEALIYCAVLDRSGNLYLGTGNNGRIFRLTPSGSGSEWAKLEESGVYALVVDSQNRVYAGTSPGGKVYRFDSQGRPEVLFDPEEKYIWALAVDDRDQLYVATGPRGIIYKVNSQGRGEVFFDSREIHIVSLNWDLNKNLLAGSAPEGKLYRISPEGRPFVLQDSPLEEMKAITVDRYGNIYAAALSGESKASGTNRSGGDTGASAGTDPSGSHQESTVQLPGTSPGGRLEIYRIDKDHLVQTLYASSEQLAFALLVRSDGTLLVATGNDGRILSISPNRFTTLLLDCGEEQVTGLLESGGKVYAVTSNLGKVYEILPQPASKGVYESEVLDAGMTAAWGLIRWNVVEPASVPVRVFTRSGNTEKPDETWGGWNGPYENGGGSRIQSPPARYLQWKIEFPQEGRSQTLLSRSNAVDFVEVSYMQRNMPPEIQSITVHAPGVAFMKFPNANPSGGIPPGGPDRAHERSLPRAIRNLESPRVTPPPRPVYLPGARSLSWNATDPNQDDLVFSLYYRRQEEQSWHPLQLETTDTHYTIDTVSFPDGIYLVRVVASDRPSNPRAQALESELVSKPFVIANSPPTVEWRPPQVQGNQALLGFLARTQASTLYQVEYALDAGDWEIVFPEDGITDGREERFQIQLEQLSSGKHTVRVRLVDSVGNIATSQQALTIP